jgi:hypothetical protein
MMEVVDLTFHEKSWNLSLSPKRSAVKLVRRYHYIRVLQKEERYHIYGAKNQIFRT